MDSKIKRLIESKHSWTSLCSSTNPAPPSESGATGLRGVLRKQTSGKAARQQRASSRTKQERLCFHNSNLQMTMNS